jgi:hypothetical protein
MGNKNESPKAKTHFIYSNGDEYNGTFFISRGTKGQFEKRKR